MRVLEVNVDDVGHGGVYAVVANVIRRKPADMTIDIACIAEFEDEEHVAELESFGTSIHYIGTSGPKFTRLSAYSRNLQALLSEIEYDAVHIHGDVAYLLLTFANAARKAGVPKIIIHSHAAGVDGKLRFIKNLLHKLTRNRLASVGTDFAACSEVAAEWMFPNVPWEEISMIHNGIPLKNFHFDPVIRREVRAELGLPMKTPRIRFDPDGEPDDETYEKGEGESCLLLGHVGRFNYQKNHEFMLDVLAELKSQTPNVKLLLIGEGPLRKDFKEKAKAYGLARDIILFGVTDRVSELMQAMDVFILPSHFEGLPVSGVEAQAAGLPCLFSDKITGEAKILETTVFLPIGSGAEKEWAAAACRRKTSGKMAYNRRSHAARIVKEAGFGIGRMIKEFLALYEGAEEN